VRKIRVAVIGSGNIGADLSEKILLDEALELIALVGRDKNSKGLKRFSGRVSNILAGGYKELFANASEFDGIFDATSAFSHLEHWEECKKYGKWAIDLTPSKIGKPLVPALIGSNDQLNLDSDFVANYSMVTCGGQSSAPIISVFAKNCTGIINVEISSSIASLSAGPATRLNIDQYIDTTENLARIITKCDTAKAILVLNPAEPQVMMRTTVTVHAQNVDLEAIKRGLSEMELLVRKYVPGYSIVVDPYMMGPNIVTSTAKVIGAGHFLPPYAGNLDIINAAAVETAKLHSNRFNSTFKVGL